MPDLLASFNRDAANCQACLLPLILIRKRVSDDSRKTYSCQPVSGFLSVLIVLRNQNESRIEPPDRSPSYFETARAALSITAATSLGCET
jgi:hypothetical protein